MSDPSKFQFRLRTALCLIALVAFYLGAQQSWFFRSWLNHYILLVLVLVVICLTHSHVGRRRAFWLGFTVVFGIHVAGVLFSIGSSGGYGMITTERWGELVYRPVVHRWPGLDPPEPWGESLFWMTWLLFVVAVSSLGGLTSLVIYAKIREAS